MDEFNQSNQTNEANETFEANSVPPVSNYVPPVGGYSYGAPAPGGQPVLPESGKATASMVLGIISNVCWFFGWLFIAPPIVSVVLGIIGLVLSSQAKAAGNNSGVRKAGFVLSLVGLIGGALFLFVVGCAACATVITY